MAEQRRIGYRWNLRQLMAQRNLWKTTELLPLLKSRGISLSNAQVHRLVTGTLERIPAQTFAALCDILECTPNDLFEPYVRMRAAKTANAPKRPEDLGITPVRRSHAGSACCHRTKMPRRKASDPVKWPEPCGRCAEHHQIAVRWPDGGICGYCYQQAKRTRGTCACGHKGVLPGRIDSMPSCRRCSGVRLNVDCIGCGNEDELHSGNRCWSCILAATVDRLLSPLDNQAPSPALQAIATALKAMKRANSGLTWIQQPHVTAFLQQLSAAPVITHARLDELPASRTREYVRGLLVEHNALPRRDELSARFGEWSDQALERITSQNHRDIIRRYIRWHHQRRMNQMDEVTQGTFLRAKQSVTVAIELLNWLTERDAELAEVTQAHLDRWQAEGPTTRGIASRFLDWATRTSLIDPSVKLQPHRRGTSPRLDATAQTELVATVSHTTDMNPRDRAAAILILVFGQQVTNIVRLTWDNVTVTEDLVSITLGTVEIALTSPLDEPWRELAATPTHYQTAAHPNSNWVFRGGSPGQHIQASTLTQRLSTAFGSRAARLGTLHELTKLAPVAIIAEALGYSPATIERHAIDSSANYAEYIASTATVKSGA